MEVFGVAVVTKNVHVAGRRISIETGRVAEQANGAVIIRQGDTVVLSTAVMSKEPREGIDFFPLTCDYEEKLYAAGKIPGAFMRREGRPTETAILASGSPTARCGRCSPRGSGSTSRWSPPCCRSTRRTTRPSSASTAR